MTSRLSPPVIFAAMLAAVGCADRSPHIRRLEPVNGVGRDLGLVAHYDFELVAPENTRQFIWVETYIKGKLEPKMTWGSEQSGATADNTFSFERYDPDVVSETKSKRGRWSCNFPSTLGYRWLDDPLKGERITSQPNDVKSWPVEVGKTYLVLAPVGGKETTGGGDDEKQMIEKNDTCVFVKARFIPTTKGAPGGGIFDGLPKFAK